MKKLVPFVEILVFYACFALLNWKFAPQVPAFVDIEPHPYWLGILLFGFRYGILAGLTAGLVSAALYFGIAWFFIEKYPFYDLTFYALPSWFIIGGTLIGTGVHRYQQRIARLVSDKEVLVGNERPLREEIKTLQEINVGLEKKIVSQMSSVMTLYEGARHLESVNLEELYVSILNFVAKTIEAEEASIYLKENTGGWVLKTSLGWKDHEKWPRRLQPTEGLIGLAGTQNKIVSVRDFVQNKSPHDPLPKLVGDCLVAGPLRLGDQGEVVGVFAVQKMPFLRFNSSNITLFSFLLQWASRSIAHAHYIKDLKAKDILDARYDTYSDRYFLARAAQEFSRSRLYYLPLAVGLVDITGMETRAGQARSGQGSEKFQEQIYFTVAQLLKQCCREIDVVATHEGDHAKFAILFITASAAQAQEMVAKIHAAFENLQLPAPAPVATKIGLKIGLANFSPQSQSLENLIQEAASHVH